MFYVRIFTLSRVKRPASTKTHWPPCSWGCRAALSLLGGSLSRPPVSLTTAVVGGAPQRSSARLGVSECATSSARRSPRRTCRPRCASCACALSRGARRGSARGTTARRAARAVSAWRASGGAAATSAAARARRPRREGRAREFGGRALRPESFPSRGSHRLRARGDNVVLQRFDGVTQHISGQSMFSRGAVGDGARLPERSSTTPPVGTCVDTPPALADCRRGAPCAWPRRHCDGAGPTTHWRASGGHVHTPRSGSAHNMHVRTMHCTCTRAHAL